MGATGYTIFEDDLGADWCADFLEDPSTGKVASILNKTKSFMYMDDLQASATLACAEVVAAALGNPVDTMPDELISWAKASTAKLAPSTEAAVHAVDVVEEKSGLQEIWSEDPKWLEYLHDLRRRLGNDA
jgi:hypothetical protein